MISRKVKQSVYYRYAVLIFSFYIFLLQAATSIPELHRFLDGAKVPHPHTSVAIESAEYNGCCHKYESAKNIQKPGHTALGSSEDERNHLCAVTFLAMGALTAPVFELFTGGLSAVPLKEQHYHLVYTQTLHKPYNPRDPPNIFS